jgi:hypothetical protein
MLQRFSNSFRATAVVVGAVVISIFVRDVRRDANETSGVNLMENPFEKCQLPSQLKSIKGSGAPRSFKEAARLWRLKSIGE